MLKGTTGHVRQLRELPCDSFLPSKGCGDFVEGRKDVSLRLSLNGNHCSKDESAKAHHELQEPSALAAARLDFTKIRGGVSELEVVGNQQRTTGR